MVICPRRALNNNRGSVATYCTIGKPYNLYGISPNMSRLNRIVDMLNWKLAEHLYAMRCVKEDEEDKKKRGREVMRLVEERGKWMAIRECVRKGV